MLWNQVCKAPSIREVWSLRKMLSMTYIPQVKRQLEYHRASSSAIILFRCILICVKLIFADWACQHNNKQSFLKLHQLCYVTIQSMYLYNNIKIIRSTNGDKFVHKYNNYNSQVVVVHLVKDVMIRICTYHCSHNSWFCIELQ